MKRVHPAIGTGVGVVGGLILWAYTNLGIMFFGLLALLLINFIAALIDHDMVSSLHKWIRVIAGIAIPSLIPNLANTTLHTWNVRDTHELIAAVFAALLAATFPNIVEASVKVGTKLGFSKTVDTALVNELERLRAQVEAYNATQSNPQPVDKPVDKTPQPPVHGV